MNQRIQKQNIREKYWRYSLYVILLGLGTVIFVELIPFLGGLLGALTIYVLLRGQMRALTIRHKLRRSLARFVLQKRMADTHPLVTIFGVIIGLSLFGFMGVIFGPVLLSIFIFCADLFKRRYLDEAPMNEVLASPAERSSESGRE